MLRVDDRESRPPLEICHERGTEFWIVGETDFICGQKEQLKPPRSLLLRKPSTEVVRDHVGVAAALSCNVGRVLRRTAKHFGEKIGDVFEMLSWHRREDRRQDRIARHDRVEVRSESGERRLVRTSGHLGGERGG